MKTYTYRNTRTDIPNFETTTHETQVFGFGYETDTHFVHFYGQEPYYIISPGLTVIEGKSTSYRKWIEQRFGAIEVEEMSIEAGHTIDGVWRPSLYYWDDIQIALNTNAIEQRSQEQAIRILVEKLDEILLFVEPSENGLKAYSHKIRELLILACTETENQWKTLLNRANYHPSKEIIPTTNDYVKLREPAHLHEFQIGLRHYDGFSPSKPFAQWNNKYPTKSLPWYNAYNDTKHNRNHFFSSATLQATIDAVAANIILYCTRFSPLMLINDTSTLSGLIKQIFKITMIDADRKSFYIPLLKLPVTIRKDCFVYNCVKNRHVQPWKIMRLSI